MLAVPPAERKPPRLRCGCYRFQFRAPALKPAPMIFSASMPNQGDARDEGPSGSWGSQDRQPSHRTHQM
jgi:hypothetical protein